MKKICLLLLCVICCLSIISCDTNTLSNKSGEHQHEWSALACGSKQKCLTCGEEKAEVTDHKWSEAVCEQKQICLICGKAQEHKIEHEWSEAVCGQKQTCLKCNEQSENIVPHTTERGVCEICGIEYVSKENQIADENARHETAKAEIYNEYSNTYDTYNAQAQILYSQITYFEDYVYSQISYYDGKIADVQTKLTVAKLDNSAAGQLRVRQLTDELTEYQNQRSFFIIERSNWQQYKTMIERINQLNNEYDRKIEAENQLHKDNIDKINAQ